MGDRLDLALLDRDVQQGGGVLAPGDVAGSVPGSGGMEWDMQGLPPDTRGFG